MGNDVVQVAARIPVSLHRRFKAACAMRGLVMNQVLQNAIESWLEEIEADEIVSHYINGVESQEGGQDDRGS